MMLPNFANKFIADNLAIWMRSFTLQPYGRTLHKDTMLALRDMLEPT